jgi:hypothetical protein
MVPKKLNVMNVQYLPPNCIIGFHEVYVGIVVVDIWKYNHTNISDTLFYSQHYIYIWTLYNW